VFGSTFCTVIVLMLFRHWGKQKNSYSILNFAGCPIIKWPIHSTSKMTYTQKLNSCSPFIHPTSPPTTAQYNLCCGERCGVYCTNTTKNNKNSICFQSLGFAYFYSFISLWNMLAGGHGLWLHSSCILTWHFSNYKATRFQCTFHIPTI